MKKQIISVALSSVIGITSVAIPYNAYADPEEDYLPLMYLSVEENDKVNIFSDGTVYIDKRNLTGDDSIRINVYIRDESKSCWNISPKIKCEDQNIKFNENAVENDTIAYASNHEFISSVDTNYNTVNMTLKTPLLETGTKLEVTSENTDDYPIAYFNADINSEIPAGEYKIYFLTEPEDDSDQRFTQIHYRYDDGNSETFIPETQDLKIIVSEGNMLGDVNGDGKVNAVDASVISVEYALLSTDGISDFTDEQNKAGDADGDGKISAIDASYVASYYAYLSTGGTETNMEIWHESLSTTTTLPITTTIPPTTTTEPPTTTTEPPTTTTEPPTTTTEPITTKTEPTTTTTEPPTTTTEPTIITTEPPTTTEPPIYSYDSHGLVNALLNLRTAPNLNSDIILQMPLNSSVTITGYTDEWYKVIYQSGGNTYYGYASRSYITDTANVDWQSAYKKILESLASEYDFTASDSLSKAMYDLVDINGNGIPELIVSSGEYHAAGCKVYTYVNGGYTATTLSDGGEGFSQYGIMGVDIVNHVARSYYCGMGYEFIDFYRLEGTQFVKIASFSNDEGNGGSDYKYNDISVTKSQYQAYWSQYNYSFDSYGREYTYTSANTPYVTGNVKTYGYTIFDGSQSHLYLSGNYSYVKVYLHYKNTSYDATVYYKGQFSGSDIRISQFNAVGSPSAYLTVTPYSSSGVAGKTITCDIPQTTSGKVEPKGQINTHGGTVAGYTKNYAVNSGTMEKVRTSLGNTWHVTIKQYYYNYNQNVNWYELYDTDDGDYYGWVDGNYIDFYN